MYKSQMFPDIYTYAYIKPEAIPRIVEHPVFET